MRDPSALPEQIISATGGPGGALFWPSSRSCCGFTLLMRLAGLCEKLITTLSRYEEKRSRGKSTEGQPGATPAASLKRPRSSLSQS